jgi:hypothetical protein
MTTSLSRRRGHRPFVAVLIAGWLAAPLLCGGSARAQPAPTAAPTAAPAESAEDAGLAARREEAKAWFDKGMVHFRQEKWEEALAALQRSRAIYPSRASTRNAALCLYKLHRADEAFEMFEALLAFSDLPTDYRQVAESAIAELEKQVGTVEIEGGEVGATIVIDGRYRGALPLPGPLRVKVGSHEVRAFKEGLDGFGATVEVIAGKRSVVQLRSLAAGGTLQVTEERGRVLDVVLDGAPVGKTPWRGSVPAGEHLVALRGLVELNTMAEECAPLIEGAPGGRRALGGNVELGTQPVNVSIRAGRPTILTLTAESLDAWLRVEPTPGGASVAIDSVTVGYGVWEGRLRAGAHKIEVSSEGFLPVTRQVTLERRKPQSLAIQLERDPTSALGGVSRRAAIGTAYGAGALGLIVGAVTGLTALDLLNGIRARCGGTRCPESEQGNLSTVRTLGDVSTVGLIVGAVGAGVGTILLLDARSRASASPAGAPGRAAGFDLKVGVAPGWIELRGSF